MSSAKGTGVRKGKPICLTGNERAFLSVAQSRERCSCGVPLATPFRFMDNGIHNIRKELLTGFTLIELTVTVSIFLIVSTIILANYPAFSQRLALNRTAQEIALSFRKAQTFALAVRGFESQFKGYGVWFSREKDDSFVFFTDFSPEDQQFTHGPIGENFCEANNECVDEFLIQTSARIMDLCKNKGIEGWTCGLDSVEVVYTRPDPIITLRADSLTGDVSNIGVVIRSPRGVERTIVVWSTGQVTIE